MYKTFEEAKQDPKFNKSNVMIFLDADQIEQLDWMETTKAEFEKLQNECVDVVPARFYPRGMWHEAGELGHCMNWRYYTKED